MGQSTWGSLCVLRQTTLTTDAMRCNSTCAFAVLACAFCYIAYASPIHKEETHPGVLATQEREMTPAVPHGIGSRSLLRVSSTPASQDDEAILEETVATTLSANNDDKDFRDLWHRTPLEMFMAWLNGIVIIVAVGALAAVVYAKLGNFEEDESVMPISPHAHRFQPEQPKIVATESPSFAVKFQSYTVEPVSVKPQVVPRYECCPNPVKCESAA